MAKQLTIRGVSDELGKRLEALAQARGKSVNTIVLEALDAALGVSQRKERLARYATWTEADLQEFEETLSVQRTVDEELWR